MDEEIKKLRQELDFIDDNLANTLEKRVALGKKIVRLKNHLGLALNDFARESQIVQRLSKQHPQVADLLNSVYRRIFDWVKNR